MQGTYHTYHTHRIMMYVRGAAGWVVGMWVYKNELCHVLKIPPPPPYNLFFYKFLYLLNKTLIFI